MEMCNYYCLRYLFLELLFMDIFVNFKRNVNISENSKK